MPTKREFAQSVKQKYPQYAAVPDDQLADAMLEKYPQYKAAITPDAGSGGGWGPTVARVATPIALGIAGSAFGPAGTAVGGGVGAGLGETLAEFLEGGDYRPKQIAAQTVLGAIPIPGASAGAPFLKQVAGQAAKGAVFGAGGAAVSDLAEGRTPTAEELLTSGGIGALLGGGLHGAFGRRIPTIEQPTVHVPEFAAMEAERNAPKTGASAWEALKRAPVNTVEAIQNRFIKPDLWTKKLAEDADLPAFKPGDSPFDQMRIEMGKGAGGAEVAADALKEIQKKAQKAGFGADVKQYLTSLQMESASDNLTNRANRVEAEGRTIGVDANSGAGVTEAPPAPGEVRAIDELKRRSESQYAEAEALRNKLAGGKALPQGLTPERVQEIKAFTAEGMGPERMSQVKEFAQPVLDYSKETAKLLHDSGLATPQAYEEWTHKNNYVPALRDIEDVVSNFMSASKEPINIQTSRGMMKLNGSTLNTLDPYEAAMVKRQIVELEAARNRSVQAFTTKFRQMSPAIEAAIPDVTGHPSKVPPGMGTIEGFEHGKKVAYAVPEEVAASLRLLNEDNAKVLGGTILNAYGRFFQRVATVANAGFAVTNPIRDVVDKAVFSKELSSPADAGKYIKDWVQIFGTNLRHDIMGGRNVEREAFLKSGAGYSTLQKDITPRMRLGTGGEDNMLRRLNIFKIIETGANNFEETTKMASMKLLEQKGITGNEALIRVRDFGGSPDFAVRGTLSKGLNTIIPFFNAQVQGISRNIKGFGQMSPARAATLLAGASALEMVRDQWNSQFVDPDGVPSAERMTDSDNQNYWTFITPNTETINGVTRHTSVKITKAHAARIIFNPISDVIQQIKHGKGSVGQTVLNEVGQFTPGSVNLKTKAPIRSALTGAVASFNPVLRAPIEQAANRTYFNDVPIVPERLRGRDPAAQFTSSTPPILRRVGEATGTSPKRLEAAVQSLIPGTTGELGVELGNRAIGQPQKGLGSSIGRRFEGSTGDQYQRNMENIFYDALAKSNSTVQTLNNLWKTNPQKARQYMAEHKEELLYRQGLTKIAAAVGKLRDLPQEKSAPVERNLMEQAMRLLGKVAPESGAQRFTKAEIDKLYAQYQRR